MKTEFDIHDQMLAPAKASGEHIPVIKGHGGLVEGVNPLSNKALLTALGDDAAGGQSKMLRQRRRASRQTPRPE